MSTHFNAPDIFEETLDPSHQYTVFSLRPAWAWAVVFGGKDLVSRPAPTRQRGRVLIHASSYHGSLREEQDLRLEVSFLTGIAQSELPIRFTRNAILGSVEIVDCVQEATSKWAVPGQTHWLLRKPRRLAAPVLDVTGKEQLWRWKMESTMSTRRSGIALRSVVLPAGAEPKRRAQK
jgi:hypothetical protein